MRKFINILALTLAVSLLPVGCAWFRTPTIQRVSYNTLYSLHEAVQTAFDGYLKLIVSGTIATNSLPKVAAGYNTFQKIYTDAAVLIGSNTNAVAPQAVVDAATSFQLTITEAKKGSL